MVNTIMSRLFTIEIGASYRLTGKSTKGKPKRIFSEVVNIVSVIRGISNFTMLSNLFLSLLLIEGVLQANELIKPTEKTETEVDHAVREWLRHCQEKIDRINGFQATEGYDEEWEEERFH